MKAHLFKLSGFFLMLLILSSCSGLRKAARMEASPAKFSKPEAALILAGESHHPMRVLLTTSQSDSLLLRAKSRSVVPDPDDEILRRLADRMYATVSDSLSRGVGIAAPQVGVLKNVIWVQRFDKAGEPFEVYFNPKILQYSQKKQECREGCLSIPNRSDTLNARSYAILIEYQKQDGQRHIEMVEDFTAVIFQHEIDHLNGVLYVDYLGNPRDTK
jgi:peptide deformylase